MHIAVTVVALLASAAGFRPPIVALTAHAMKGADEECRTAGMDDYLTKPLDRGKLIDRLQRHLADRTAA